MPAPRVLVVEDESIVALNLRQQLLKLGYDVPDAVATGDQALREIEAVRPDVVLMDINLKGQMDGITTASRIPAALRVPIIYLTAYSEETTLPRASATNPYGYLLKPFSEREVHAMIQMTLARCRAEYAAHIALESRRQAEKMDALGQLATGVAQEFNDLLDVIYGQLEVLGHHAISHPALAETIDGTFGAAIEKEKLVRRMLAFGGQQTLMRAETCLAGLISGVAKEPGDFPDRRIRMEPRIPDDIWSVYVDARRLACALRELVKNARDAMPDGGSLTIAASNVMLDRHAADAIRTETSGRYVLLALTDTGSGMTQSVIDRAFEPFFTTKPAAGGLGLSLVFGFIRQSGGHISIDSEPGLGATVRLYLPVAPEPGAVTGDPSDLPAMATDGAAARILAAGAATTMQPPDVSAREVPLTKTSWRHHDFADHVEGPATLARTDDGLSVPWHHADNALFASVSAGPGGTRYRLSVEALPKRNGWDWVVWRAGDSEASARHGRASSVSIAMAAAEAAARQWDMADLNATAEWAAEND